MHTENAHTHTKKKNSIKNPIMCPASSHTSPSHASPSHASPYLTTPQDDLEAARAVFDAFLTRYPLCYAYWKKYADFEKKKGGTPDVVYQRGVQAFPYSPELWSYYAGLLTSQGAAEQDVRRCDDKGVGCWEGVGCWREWGWLCGGVFNMCTGFLVHHIHQAWLVA